MQRTIVMRLAFEDLQVNLFGGSETALAVKIDRIVNLRCVQVCHLDIAIPGVNR
jgi:hypothetical protein